MNLHLREIFSPVLLNERNVFRFQCPRPPPSLSATWSWLLLGRHARHKPAVPRVLSQAELDYNLDEWITTWRRKRSDIGRDVTSFVVKNLAPDEIYPMFAGPAVFDGTMFPTRDEWLYMHDNYDKYITTLPWDREAGPEKFLQWNPSYREEIMGLLREPYDFKLRREVWMFGYGSLISPNSPPAGLTENQRKQIIPYWLKKQAGYRRVWNYRHGPVGINAFGLELVDDDDNNDNNNDDAEAMNIAGCVYPMDYEKASDLFSFREEGYELLLVHEDYFEPMHKDYAIPKGAGYLWVCGQPIRKECPSPPPRGVADENEKKVAAVISTTETTTTTKPPTPMNDPSRRLTRTSHDNSPSSTNIASKRHYPTHDSPILQSYIDTVIEGALRYRTAGLGHEDGMNFAAAIIVSTAGWNFPWYDDRLLPGRPWTFSPKYELIDGLLSTCPTSRDAFIFRLRATMQRSNETKRCMLEGERDSNIKWARNYYYNGGGGATNN